MTTRKATGTAVVLGIIAVAVGLVSNGLAAGTLTPNSSPDQPIRMRSHHVDIVVNNGFARIEVTQVFFNPNAKDLEGIYSFPLPKSASLSEMTIWAGERELNGEVLSKDEVDKIYEEEKQKGNDTGKAQKNSYQTFEFYVSPIRANGETKMRFVYYQPLHIDTGVARLLYPLESGGTDELATQFWTQNEKVDGQFSVHAVIKSAHPIVDVRVPGYENAAQIQSTNQNNYVIDLAAQDTSLNRDLVIYYRLADNLPGRFEVIPYRADPNKPGTFMMVVTPGIDLGPLTNGADYVYILDISGSMQGGKIQMLANGVAKAIGGMRPHDRFRIITFNQSAHELTRGWVAATPDNVRTWLKRVKKIKAGGSTNLHAGMSEALRKLDDDRATSIVLVTDGVTNTGLLSPKAFRELLAKHDVRIFGFVMGNSANWPLMQMIGKLTGGFSVGVSNQDDIVGQIMLAKGKVLSESLHDASISISGVKTFAKTDEHIGKIYRGDQLVLFGRYEKAGKARVSLHAKLTGEDKTYSAEFEFPVTDVDNPEIERLWALNQIEQQKQACMMGLLPTAELEDLERSLGIEYQLVTDETSMIVLSDEVYKQRGIERRNRTRVAVERQAQAQRASQPVRNYTVGNKPSFPARAPRPGSGGGGALDPFTTIGIVLLSAFGVKRFSRRER